MGWITDLKWCFLVSQHSFCLWSNKVMPCHLNEMIMFACNSFVAHPWRLGHMMPCEIWAYMRSSGVFWLDSIWGASKVGGYELLALLQDLVQNLQELMHLFKHLVQNHLNCKFHSTNTSNIPFYIKWSTIHLKTIFLEFHFFLTYLLLILLDFKHLSK